MILLCSHVTGTSCPAAKALHMLHGLLFQQPIPMQSTAAALTTAASATTKHRCQPRKAVKTALGSAQPAGGAAAEVVAAPKDPASLAAANTTGYTVRQVSRAARKGLDQVCAGLGRFCTEYTMRV